MTTPLRRAGAARVPGLRSPRPHPTAKILRLSEDLPIVVEIVDEPHRTEESLPVLAELMAEGMVTLEPVRVITYRHHAGDR